MTERRKDVLAIAFLIVLITVFFSAEVFTDRTLITFRLTNAFPWRADATPEQLAEPSVTSDCTFSYFPRRVFATRLMREGEIPLWNPHQFCGTPFLANYQSGVLYPVNLALYPVDPHQQMDLFVYIHFIIAAIFTYLLARRLGISPGGSLVSALALTFSGFMATRYGQPTFISTAAYIPALLYFGEGLVLSPGLKRAGLLAAALAMCMLAGFPQIVFLAVYSLALYVIVRVFLVKGAGSRRRLAIIGLLAFSIVVAAFVCAFQLLPTYELSTYSYRKALSYEMILTSAHHRLAALKYFIPDILGHPLDVEVGVVSKGLDETDTPYGFSQNYVSTTGYAGILTLLLALVALARPRRRMVPFIVLGGLALLAVFGTPLLRVFYILLPGFKFSRIDRIIVVYMLSVSLLAGFGFDTFQAAGSATLRDSGPGRRFRMAALIAAAFAVFAVLLGVWLSTSGIESIVGATGDWVRLDVFRTYAMAKVQAFLLLSLVGAGFLSLAALKPMPYRVFMVVALCLLLADLLPFAARFKVSQPAEEVLPRNRFVETLPAKSGGSRIVKYVADVLPASTPTLLGIDDIHGYNALNVDHYIEVLGAIDSTVVATENAALRRRIGPLSSTEGMNSKLLDMLNAVHILTVMRIEGRIQPVKVNNEGALPRAYLVGEARRFGTYEEVLDYMKTGEFDPRVEVLIVGESGAGPDSVAARDSVAGPGRVVISTYRPQEVVMDVKAETDCWLFMSDTYYPGWRAYVDGSETPILRANYAFRGLALSQGRHEVRMVFESGSFRIGTILSVAGLVLLGVLLATRSAAASL
jgi:hypothetical protein